MKNVAADPVATTIAADPVAELERRQVRDACAAANWHMRTAVDLLLKSGWTRQRAEQAVDAAFADVAEVDDDLAAEHGDPFDER